MVKKLDAAKKVCVTSNLSEQSNVVDVSRKQGAISFIHELSKQLELLAKEGRTL